MNDESAGVRKLNSFSFIIHRSSITLKIMIPPDGQRREHVENGVRNRVIACRQRLRRTRASSQQKSPGGLSGFKPLIEDEPLMSRAGTGSVESAGILPDVKAVERRV